MTLYQRGLLSVDLLRALAFIAAMTVLSTQAFRYYANIDDARRIERTVSDIALIAQQHYQDGVLDTRCLAQPPIDMETLLLNPIDDLGTYQVGYDEMSTTLSQPHHITVSFTFTRLEHKESIGRYLAPNYHDTRSGFYQFPLDYQLPDFQQVDRATGCIK
ncbi:hypothetical protein [Aliivibrio fischeri]|uniref:hypothetical protein n=1 Tax=Aliivibrio fischeri TaxID=668 RepID=UPI00084C5E87|nr:hypothetical protein [Aliivibrio fischeri]OED56707.1 hypothetical protein BEI47_13415 [Aliivibrio fischeri]